MTNQVPRGTLADAEANETSYLFKRTSTLRLTYQIRLLAFRAIQSRQKLVIQVPIHCQIQPPLQDLVDHYSDALRIDKVD
ncbi:MAG TPA: hypothetical protein VG056_15190 [Pirellulales bacterium]|nr:hypothetical protein [Pirellulales bacterium]